jgi:hypothetical protein
MADQKISQLTADATPTGADYATTIKSPFGAASNRKVLLSDLAGYVARSLADGSLGAPSLAFLSDSDTGIFRPASNSLSLVAGGSSVLTVGGSVSASIDQILSSSGTPTAFRVNGAALTGLTASNSIEDVVFSLNRTVTWEAGAIAFQSFFNVNAGATMAFAGASSVTAAIGSSFNGVPSAGTNASLGLGIGTLFAPGDSNGDSVYGLLVTAPGISSGKGNVGSLYGLNFTGGFIGSSLGNQTATLANLASIRVDSITYTSSTNVRTVTGEIAGAILNAPVAGSNVSFSTTSLGLLVKSGESRFAATLSPTANDGAALGSSSLSFSDLFLASGGVINWANSDVGITHSTNRLAFTGATGATLGYSFDNNVVIGASTAGASATNTLCLGNIAADPTTSADRTHLYSKDISAGNATLAIYTERAVAADAALVSTNSFSVFINGTQYKIPLVA